MVCRAPIKMDGLVIGTITVGLSEEMPSRPSAVPLATPLLASLGEPGTEPFHGEPMSPPSAQGRTSQPQVIPHHIQRRSVPTSGTYGAPAQKQESNKQPTFRPGLTPRGSAEAAKPQHFTIGDVKSAVEGGKKAGAAGGWWTSERVNHAIDYLKKNAGLPELGARALVARWAGVEAAGGPSEINSIGATGIGQWLGSRKIGVVRGDFEGQLAHVVEELKGTGAIRDPGSERAYQRLRSATNEYDAAIGASMYERAEDYNDRTGVDRYTGKTVDTMRRMGVSTPSPTVGVTRLGSSPAIAPSPSVDHITNPSTPGALRTRSGVDLSVDPRLKEILGAGAAQFEALNPGYQVVVTSGRRMGADQAQHASQAGAIDLQIVDKSGGHAVPNAGGDTTGLYTQLAKLNRGEMLARHPELEQHFNWGGYFGADKRGGLANPFTGQGYPDLMHYDLGGQAYPGRAGITEAYRKLGVLPGMNYGKSPTPTPTKAAEIHGSPL
jgi:hypothetical protein